MKRQSAICILNPERTPHDLQPSTASAALCAALAVVAALGACATASGPQFTRLEPVSAASAQVYLYHKSAIYASAAAYDVSHNGKAMGKLFNASYAVLPVTPGEHEFSVDERGQERSRGAGGSEGSQAGAVKHMAAKS